MMRFGVQAARHGYGVAANAWTRTRTPIQVPATHESKAIRRRLPLRRHQIPGDRCARQAPHLLLRKLPQALGRAHAHVGGVPGRECRMGRSGRKAVDMALVLLVEQSVLQHLRHHDRCDRRRADRRTRHRSLRSAAPQGTRADVPRLRLAQAPVVACSLGLRGRGQGMTLAGHGDAQSHRSSAAGPIATHVRLRLVGARDGSGSSLRSFRRWRTRPCRVQSLCGEILRP